MTVPYRGFESYNKFKKNIKNIKQLYDVTYHLYTQEHLRLKPEFKNKKNKKVSIKTSVGEIMHGLNTLYDRLENSYPFSLRQYLLISSITYLEVYLTDVVYEVFSRDITPFKKDSPITLQQNYLLNLHSVKELQEWLISKDMRSLTSGGLQVIGKYFKKHFNIEFSNLNIDFKSIEEIHTRRHLFVHRDGIADKEYSIKFPTEGVREGHRIKIEHSYLIKALDNLSEFAGLINKKLIEFYPQEIRKPKYELGNASFDFELTNLMVEIGLESENYDYKDFFNNLTARPGKLTDYIVQITAVEKTLSIFLSGRKNDLMKFFKPIKENPNLNLIKIIELKNNAS